MKTYLNCIPCFVQQTLTACRFVTDDESVHESVLRDVLAMLKDIDMHQTPPAMAMRVYRLIRQRTGREDPYQDVKDQTTREVLRLLPDLRRQVRQAADPFTMAVRFAIGGNTIDCGVGHEITLATVGKAFEHALDGPLDGDVGEFQAATRAARSILYVADNAGEIVADRLLIEQLPAGRVTLAVRGRAVLNDATRADAEAAGYDDRIEIIDNGSDAPGTVLQECSDAFRRRFAEADLIIAKGQGNFETLSDAEGNIFFLFKVKCPVISHHTGCPMGHLLVRKNAAAPR
ncbi:MAG: DUF89 family protein [Phycisphaerae bacterium]|nr:DUF89 family protein [Phycisphaerae bacterium]